VFNVEPLGDGTRGGGSGEVKLLNPAREGEVVATTLPEFRGVAPGSTVLAITVHSNTPYSDTVIASNDGTWAWSPPDELEPGEHVITIAYLDTDGIEQIIERTFTVSKALAQEGDPSFEATPSGSTASPSPSPSPSLKPSPTGSSVATASPRVTTPSTQSGVPVSGVLEYTWLTAGLGLLVIVLGVTLLAL
jgi:hypothetical protein